MRRRPVWTHGYRRNLRFTSPGALSLARSLVCSCLRSPSRIVSTPTCCVQATLCVSVGCDDFPALRTSVETMQVISTKPPKPFPLGLSASPHSPCTPHMRPERTPSLLYVPLRVSKRALCLVRSAIPDECRSQLRALPGIAKRSSQARLLGKFSPSPCRPCSSVLYRSTPS